MTKVTIKQHLRELQWRFLLIAAFFIIGAVLAYYFQKPLIDALLAPLNGQKLVYLTPGGGFNFVFLISIYAGLALAVPVLIQQLYAFLHPVLPPRAHKKSPIIIISAFLLLAAGVAFGYFVAVPNALAFLYSFAEQYVDSSLTAESYLNFIIGYTIGIGLVFQLPLILLLINLIKPLTPGGLLKSEKWVLLLSFVVAAIITPTPDPVNQAIIAGPVIVVYQIGVVAVLISIYRERAKKRRELKLARKIARKETIADEALKEVKAQKAPLPVHSLATTQTPIRPTQVAEVNHPHINRHVAPSPKQMDIMRPRQTPQQHTPSTLVKQLEQHANINNAHPAQATKHAEPVRTHASVDGFVRRPATLPLRVPQRDIAAAQLYAVGRKPAPAQKEINRQRIVDGISAPKRAISY